MHNRVVYSKSKIDYIKLVIGFVIGAHDVLWLQITMYIADHVQSFKSLEHLYADIYDLIETHFSFMMHKYLLKVYFKARNDQVAQTG
jgi:hypothetical protein